MSASTRVSNRKSRILLRFFCFVKTRSHLVHPSTVLGSRCLLMPDSGQLALLLTQKLNFALTKLIWGSLQLTSESGFPAQHLRVSPIEPPDRNDYNVQVQADLSRLNAEQLIALKHLALIASGGNTETVDRSSNPAHRSVPQRKAGPGEGARPHHPGNAVRHG